MFAASRGLIWQAESPASGGQLDDRLAGVVPAQVAAVGERGNAVLPIGMRSRLVVVVLAVGAVLSSCGAGQHATPAPPPPTCATAAAHTASVFAAQLGDQLADGQAAIIEARLAQTCADAAWTDASVGCFADAAASQAVMACTQALTLDQEAALADTLAPQFAPQPD